jgi:hypothetical protein
MRWKKDGALNVIALRTLAHIRYALETILEHNYSSWNFYFKFDKTGS